MKPFIIAVLLAVPALGFAQNRSTELDKAYEDARTAATALKEAEQKRDQGVEPQSGERQSTATGATRPTEAYLNRQAQLEMEVEAARKRHEAAQKRWNDLK